MDFAKSIEPVTALKSRSADLIRKARESGMPLVITQNGRATAVLMDVESYERQRQALLLLRFAAQGDGELRAGQGVDHEQARAQLETKLQELAGE